MGGIGKPNRMDGRWEAARASEGIVTGQEAAAILAWVREGRGISQGEVQAAAALVDTMGAEYEQAKAVLADAERPFAHKAAALQAAFDVVKRIADEVAAGQRQPDAELAAVRAEAEALRAEAVTAKDAAMCAADAAAKAYANVSEAAVFKWDATLERVQQSRRLSALVDWLSETLPTD